MINAATGAIAQRIDYDEYGFVILDTHPGFQPFGYAGGLIDQHTKQVRFGAREYYPKVGRRTRYDLRVGIPTCMDMDSLIQLTS